MRKIRFTRWLYFVLCAGLCALLLIPAFAENTDESADFMQLEIATPEPEDAISEEWTDELPPMKTEVDLSAEEPPYVKDAQDEPESQEPAEPAGNEDGAFAPDAPMDTPEREPEITPEQPRETAHPSSPHSKPSVGSASADILPETASVAPKIVEPTPLAAQGSWDAAFATAPNGGIDLELSLYGMDEIDLDDGLHQSVPPRFPEGVTSMGSNRTIAQTDDEIANILATLPDGLSDARKSVVIKAYSLVGHVAYYWGGKSTVQGWDVRWGNPAYVESEGSEDGYALRTYGLDCSGYVSWVFCNAGDSNQVAVIGNGSSNQWARSSEVGWADALPGDLAFFAAPGERPINHVGIVVEHGDDGRLMIAHCSSRRNAVVVTDAEETGFTRIRRPEILNDDGFLQAAESVFLQCCTNGDESAKQALESVGSFGEESAQPDGEEEAIYAFGDSVTLRLERAANEGEPQRGIIIGQEGDCWIVAFPASEGTRVVYARAEDMERAD